MIPLFGLLAGLILGLFLEFDIPQQYTSYIALIILALVDAIFGAVRSNLQGTFRTLLFVTGLGSSIVVSLALAALGSQLNMQLELAAIFALGNRIFVNVSLIRRFLVERAEKIRQKKESEAL